MLGNDRIELKTLFFDSKTLKTQAQITKYTVLMSLVEFSRLVQVTSSEIVPHNTCDNVSGRDFCTWIDTVICNCIENCPCSCHWSSFLDLDMFRLVLFL